MPRCYVAARVDVGCIGHATVTPLPGVPLGLSRTSESVWSNAHHSEILTLPPGSLALIRLQVQIEYYLLPPVNSSLISWLVVLQPRDNVTGVRKGISKMLRSMWEFLIAHHNPAAPTGCSPYIRAGPCSRLIRQPLGSNSKLGNSVR